ncbi:MAG: DNA mismatch repair endonuclease MutL [Nitrospirales bacterium]|nr:DNA mismatch repair endonuclease MutL [Nitrospirales bacterium]
MSVITVLPEHLRNKIAAGEVVERPASVVKELMENSIDADSTRIEIEVVRAGRSLLRVSDNGRGMGREDALLAFERHTTSKIREESDLFAVRTMGFRGEALASIASVARVKLSTAAGEGAAEAGPAVPGTCIEISGGELRKVRDCPAAGTSIEVKDLFFNTPARRKFLKSDTTENYHITDTVTRAALSHPHIGFFLQREGETVLSLPAASSLRERLVQVHGKDFMEGLQVGEAEGGRMGGAVFVSKPSFLRNNRGSQYLFINRRPVRDPGVTQAVYKAYEGLLPVDRHPLFFLYLEMDPSGVDFNVHPAKREVRFENKSTVFHFVFQAVRDVLRRGAETDRHPEGGHPLPPPFHASGGGSAEGIGEVPYPEEMPVSGAGYAVSEAMNTAYALSAPVLYLGDTLVAIPERGGLLLLDYHAAHERINYERLLKRTEIQGYPLLFPHPVKLQSGEYEVILSHLSLLSSLGLEAEDFGHGSVVVRSLPDLLRDADSGMLLSDVAAALLRKEERGIDEKGFEPVDALAKAVAARMACHLSIRGKEVPDGVRIAALLKSLARCENPDSCPHGRPTKIFLSREELRKMFRK